MSTHLVLISDLTGLIDLIAFVNFFFYKWPLSDLKYHKGQSCVPLSLRRPVQQLGKHFGKIDLDGYFGKIAWKEILWGSYISCYKKRAMICVPTLQSLYQCSLTAEVMGYLFLVSQSLCSNCSLPVAHAAVSIEFVSRVDFILSLAIVICNAFARPLGPHAQTNPNNSCLKRVMMSVCINFMFFSVRGLSVGCITIRF